MFGIGLAEIRFLLEFEYRDGLFEDVRFFYQLPVVDLFGLYYGRVETISLYLLEIFLDGYLSAKLRDGVLF